MGFLETFENTEIEQEEEIVETYTYNLIEEDDNSNDENIIDENDIMLLNDETETTETTETIVYEVIDYTEQLENIVGSLDVIQLLGTIIVCYIVSNLVFGFMKIRKEGDL